MPAPQLDRRSLLKFGGGLGASLLAGASFPALAATAATNRDADTFQVLTATQAATLDSMSARIIPTTDTPGAREAGAVWFMDAVLGSDLAENLGMLESGITDLNDAAGGDFASLAPGAQDELLRSIEDGDFFDLVRFMTLAGTLTMSKYGGNRGEVGWDLIGLNPQHHWSPPFGHYDRGHHGETES